MKMHTRHCCCMLALFLIATIASLFCCTGTPHHSRQGLARVDSILITNRDLDLCMSVEKAYGNDHITREAALVALVNSTLALEVAKRVDMAPTQEDINALSRHADEHSKAPEILARVKEVFGKDRGAYERLYLAPKVVNHKLHSYHSRNLEIHAAQAALIEQAYRMVLGGRPFKETAHDLGLQYRNTTYGDEGDDKGELPPALQQYFPEGGAHKNDPLMVILETLSEGEIYKNIIEHDRAFQVLRLLEKQGSHYRIESITIAKRPFQEWFEGEASAIEISILDPALAQGIVSRYPTLWWVKQWCTK